MAPDPRRASTPMLMFTRAELDAKLTNLEAQHAAALERMQKAQADTHAIGGAIQFVHQLIAELEAGPVAPAPPALSLVPGKEKEGLPGKEKED